MIDNTSAENQLKLVAAVLGAKTQDNETTTHLKNFEKYLNEDYSIFAGKETTFKDDAGALKKLQNVHEQLLRVVQFPMLFTKNIVAVAGGFSSGKSSFLNTFFKDSAVKLSVDMDPTTAIPTLIVTGNETCVTAYTPDGRQGNIPVEIFSKIDHKLINELHFNLLSIMPYVTVSVPFENKDELNNICFIDTPGYDAAGKDSKEDRNISLKSLMSASAVIWAIPVDSGEIRQNDLNFLGDILEEDENKKIFILCTKSDSRLPSDVQNIMRKIRETLDDEYIDVEGISAVTTISGMIEETVFEDEERSVFDFLKQMNCIKISTISRCKELTDQVSNVFDEYKKSINEDIERCKERKQKINSKTNELQRFINEIDQKTSFDIDFDIDFSEFLEDKTAEDKENLEKCKSIEKSMCDSIRAVFPDLKCPSCGKKIDNDSLACTNCGTSTFGYKGNGNIQFR